MLTIVTKSSILGVAAVLDPPLESEQLLLCTRWWKNDQLCDQLLFMQLEKKLNLPRWSGMIKSNTKPLTVKVYLFTPH